VSDFKLLFATRIVRMFAYGSLSVVLLLYLAKCGFTEAESGALLTLTLIGDTCISLWMTANADRIGRKKMLILGALLMLAAGIVFAYSHNFFILLIAAAIGVISPSGNEVGPFLSIEQAALTQTIPSQKRTQIFAWYNLAGSFATALGALAAGAFSQFLQHQGWTSINSYRAIVIVYAILGLFLFIMFQQLSKSVEIEPTEKPEGLKVRWGLHRSRNVVLRLSALFAMDAFAGGFIMQSIIAYWFYKRFGLQPAALGTLFFFANILAGFSALAAARIASRIGLIRTMVFTHIPSNLMLIAIPFMPTVSLAVGVLLLRFSISQMDVPTRQSYLMAVVSADERSAAAGITGIARSIGASLSPVLAGTMLSMTALFSAPFFLAGGLKVVYDLLLYRNFKSVHPEEELLTK
jgi:MFS family permease